MKSDRTESGIQIKYVNRASERLERLPLCVRWMMWGLAISMLILYGALGFQVFFYDMGTTVWLGALYGVAIITTISSIAPTFWFELHEIICDRSKDTEDLGPS